MELGQYLFKIFQSFITSCFIPFEDPKIKANRKIEKLVYSLTDSVSFNEFSEEDYWLANNYIELVSIKRVYLKYLLRIRALYTGNKFKELLYSHLIETIRVVVEDSEINILHSGNDARNEIVTLIETKLLYDLHQIDIIIGYELNQKLREEQVEEQITFEKEEKTFKSYFFDEDKFDVFMGELLKSGIINDKGVVIDLNKLHGKTNLAILLHWLILNKYIDISYNRNQIYEAFNNNFKCNVSNSVYYDVYSLFTHGTQYSHWDKTLERYNTCLGTL